MSELEATTPAQDAGLLVEVLRHALDGVVVV